MQTASVVDPGRLRAGAQLSAAAFCGDAAQGPLIGLTRCTEYPDGIPLPELRLNGRYGFTRRFDVGVSAQALGQLIAPERAFQFGLTTDVKAELLRIPTAGPTHIVSTGLLGGAALAGRFGLPLWAQLEWGVPLFYGLSFERWEFVVGANLSQRALFARLGTDAARRPSDTWRLGLVLGLFRKNPVSWGIQLGYLTDPARFSTGAIQLQFGWFFERSVGRETAPSEGGAGRVSEG
jgi:hypothetical protein